MLKYLLKFFSLLKKQVTNGISSKIIRNTYEASHKNVVVIVHKCFLTQKQPSRDRNLDGARNVNFCPLTKISHQDASDTRCPAFGSDAIMKTSVYLKKRNKE